MANTCESAGVLAAEVLACCLRGERWPAAAVRELIAADGGRTLLGTVVEGLSDRFEPQLTGVYAALFSEAIEACLPEYHAPELVARYGRVRQVQRFSGDVRAIEEVAVLSRVTLGADIAVTSVLLDAARRRFPAARILLAGPRKNWELFAGDPRIGHLPADYGRDATVCERLAARPRLEAPGRIVLDPDSRLSQLGLLPVCPEERYYYFDSRAFGGEGDEPLKLLARRWAAQTLGIAGARAWAAPPPFAVDLPAVPFACVSFGVGENPAKRVPDPFEEHLLRGLLERGATLVVDTGAGGEEAERVRRAAARCGRTRAGQVLLFEGSFAAFASAIARSSLYVGYDSAGQHVAAALGIPLVAVFAGFPSDRFLARWHPAGEARTVVIRHEASWQETLARALAAVEDLLIR